MKIENIGMPKNISEKAQLPVLSEGDVLIAEVTGIKGDRAFLKNQDGGAVLTAKLLGDIGVAVGDFVETVVDEAGGGRYVLRIVDISRQAPFASETDAASGEAVQNQARAQTLLNTLATLRNNPGADPKVVAFLSKHGFAGTAENIEAMSQMAKGASSLTALLSQVIKSLGTEAKAFSPQTEGGAHAASQPTLPLETQGTGQTAQSAVNTPDIPTGETQREDKAAPDAVQNGAKNAGLPTAQTAGVQADTVKWGVQAQKAQSAGEPKAAQAAYGQDTARMPAASGGTGVSFHPSGAPEAAGQAETAPVQTDIAPQGAPAAGSADRETAEQPLSSLEEAFQDSQKSQNGVRGGGNEELGSAGSRGSQSRTAAPGQKSRQIVDKALAMLVQTDDTDQLAVRLRKAVNELPDQLKELKLLIDDADSIDKDTIAAKFDQMEKQISLMSEVKRFDCYQIPLQAGAQQQAGAELYVYRYRGGKKAVDDENILILLGLDMPNMGRVETLVKTSGRDLNIEFNLEDMRLGDEMKADALQLDGAVQQAGYHFAGVSVKQLAARTTVLNAEERFEKETGGSAGNLDIRI